MELTPAYRKIIHVDMDAFYASVEQLDNKELVGKPVAVGGSSERGVVAAASYEARKYGVKSAMSGVLAKKKCPHLIFVKPRFSRYKEISEKIRQIFNDYTDLVEPLSLDEAYLDVTENKKGNPSASLIAQEIRDRIFNELNLRASAGISINKFIAKVASDINKPNGQKTINPEEVILFLEELSVNKFYGVGKVTAAKMNNIGIFKGLDLKNKSLEELTRLYGKSGKFYYNIVRGVHNSLVKPNRVRKSIAAERTFSKNISSEVFMLERLDKIAEELEKRMMKSKTKGKTITLKIKYSDFTQQTRSKTIQNFMQTKDEIMNIVKELVYQEKFKNSVRLLGISFSNLDTEKKAPVWVQLKLDF
ncbi:DNA polymerase IV [Flavobacteriaceae bacterium]|nr:DNA polymerase IV [Flavobacteriaceae bacterium]MDB2427567.1 DNA polymerase IV [Flavobacteriaceae bacterium]MDB2632865.1 DNA polymerase IV [Flavobacteriaceae bacterium]MDB2684906.1 DNA polymerase IV [Flavobacteriaceae bacterium]MDC0330795.1 DNA polymerase IV [Flavobacteriaceae bacterium]